MAKISLFLVTYDKLQYYTLIDEFDRDDLALCFVKYEQTHVKEFNGPENWAPDMFVYFVKLFKAHEIYEVEGLPLYSKHYVNKIWAIIRDEIDTFNKAYEIIKE